VTKKTNAVKEGKVTRAVNKQVIEIEIESLRIPQPQQLES
jgi:hypothetical protein